MREEGKLLVFHAKKASFSCFASNFVLRGTSKSFFFAMSVIFLPADIKHFHQLVL